MALRIVLAILLLLCMIKISKINAQTVLEVGFYTNKCNAAVENIVRGAVREAFFRNPGFAPGLIRMHFHDCFVRGCDGSVLIDSTGGNVAEKEGPPNNGSLRGFEVIDTAKARLEAICPGVVSCADILSFAARDAVVITGGLGWDVPAGRRDGRVSLASETVPNIPAPFFNLSQLTQSFDNKGLTQKEMVILSGAHTVGRSHCTSFSNRLYNFGPSSEGQDPSLNPLYADQLKMQCPKNQQGNVDPNLVIQMNMSPALMENSYYKDILIHRVPFTSDQTLDTAAQTGALVREYANNNKDWLTDFRDAMIKMSQIGVLTGNDGEIRLNCSRINP